MTKYTTATFSHATPAELDMLTSLLMMVGKARPPLGRCQRVRHTNKNGGPIAGTAARPQDSRPRIGVFSALAARVGSKYSRRNAILPPIARRNSTYSW